jgi:pilus assembly protein Flp/PilA
MIYSIEKFVANEDAATAIEYALITSLIAVVIIGVLSNVGTQISNVFNEISNNLK